MLFSLGMRYLQIRAYLRTGCRKHHISFLLIALCPVSRDVTDLWGVVTLAISVASCNIRIKGLFVCPLDECFGSLTCLVELHLDVRVSGGLPVVSELSPFLDRLPD